MNVNVCGVGDWAGMERNGKYRNAFGWNEIVSRDQTVTSDGLRKKCARKIKHVLNFNVFVSQYFFDFGEFYNGKVHTSLC